MTKLSSVRSLGKKRVAVRVRRIGGSNKYEVVPGSITMLSGEVKVGERDGALIVDENGEAMQPTGNSCGPLRPSIHFIWSQIFSKRIQIYR